MYASTKLVEKLERIDNFCTWKYRIGLILAENDLARFIKEEVSEPEDVIEKAKHQKDSIRAQRIIADSIKDHLIPYVSFKKCYNIMDVLIFPLKISRLSPNHRPKPPSEHLNLDRESLWKKTLG